MLAPPENKPLEMGNELNQQVTFSTNTQMKEASKPDDAPDSYIPNVKAEYKGASYNDLMHYHGQEYK